MVLKLLAKFVAVCLIVVPISWFLYSIGEKTWTPVIVFWGWMAFVIAAYQLFVFTAWLLRKALIFLGMKPETADMDCGSPGGGWCGHSLPIKASLHLSDEDLRPCSRFSPV